MTPVDQVQSGNAGAQQTSAAKQNDVAAIDILLDPDATMIQRATAANARLLQNFPKGYTLGGAHAPHISVLQQYVKTASLDQVYAAADKVFANENPPSWKLTAFKYYYIPDKAIGLAGIVIKPTADLLRLQQALIDAVKPFEAPTGTAAAFVTTPQDPISSRRSFRTSQSSFPSTAAITMPRTSPLASALPTF